jgi:hypothetical protein
MEHGPSIAERIQKAVYIMRCLVSNVHGPYPIFIETKTKQIVDCMAFLAVAKKHKSENHLLMFLYFSRQYAQIFIFKMSFWKRCKENLFSNLFRNDAFIDCRKIAKIDRGVIRYPCRERQKNITSQPRL